MLIVFIYHFLFVYVLSNDNSNVKTPFFETVMRRRCVMLTETVKALLTFSLAWLENRDKLIV